MKDPWELKDLTVTMYIVSPRASAVWAANRSLTLSHTHSLSHALSQTLSLSHTHTLSLALTHTLTHSHTLTHTLTLWQVSDAVWAVSFPGMPLSPSERREWKP